MVDNRAEAGPEAIRAARTSWRRGQIINAAVRILEVQSFHQMSMSDLAEEAGISVGTVYQYIDSKEDVLVMVIVDILEAYRSALVPLLERKGDPVDDLRATFRAYCSVVESRRSAVVLGYGASRALPPEGRRVVMSLERETTGLLTESVRRGVDLGVFEATSPELVGWSLAVLAHTWALKHWHMSQLFSFDEYVEYQLASVIGALVPHRLRDNLRKR